MEKVYYGMFSDLGNIVVHAITQAAIKENSNSEDCWNTVYDDLEKLQKVKIFSECTDTAVREEVWAAIVRYYEGR